MKIFHITKGLIKTFFLKIFPSLGYKGVVDTLIIVYDRLEKKFPTASKDDLLNSLIMSRVKALPRVASLEEEQTYYEPLLQNPNKTLEDVIWEIVKYEYIESRKESLLNQLSKTGFSQKDTLKGLNEEKEKCKKYIRESIRKNNKS